jgi:hypothetical protein
MPRDVDPDSDLAHTLSPRTNRSSVGCVVSAAAPRGLKREPPTRFVATGVVKPARLLRARTRFCLRGSTVIAVANA